MVSMNGGGTANPFVEGAKATSMDSIPWYINSDDTESGIGTAKIPLNLPIQTRENEAFVIHSIETKEFHGMSNDGKIETVVGTTEIPGGTYDDYSGAQTSVSEEGMLYERELYFDSDTATAHELEAEPPAGTAVPYGNLYVYAEFDLNNGNSGGSLGRVWGTTVEVSDSEATSLLRQYPR